MVKDKSKSSKTAKHSTAAQDKFSLRTVILLVFLGMLLGVGSTAWVYTEYRFYGTQYVLATARFTNESKGVGFVLDNDALRFGTLSPGYSVQRTIILTNTHATPVKVRITHTGNLSPYLSINTPEFYLIGHEQKTVMFMAINPGVDMPGNYTAMVKVQYLRP